MNWYIYYNARLDVMILSSHKIAPSRTFRYIGVL